jgi:hypothetical protein
MKQTTTVTIAIKSNYGKEAIYPICETAKVFAEIAGTKTVSRGLLKQIESLGYTITIKPQSL